MIRVLHGDSREVLRTLPADSLDSCVTDPPYALVSIVKRFGSPNAAPAKGNDAYMRASAGFMGKQWDTGECAMDPAFWAEVLRVLKPGAHLVAFGATRGYHRMACAIEDAGFEIRDSLAWLYGTGFPKSHDVSKGIDRETGKQMAWFGPWLRIERERRGITQKELAAYFPSKTGGLTGCVANWELGFNIPTIEQFNTLCRVMSLPFQYLDDLEREVIGQKTASKLAVAPGQENDRSATTLDVTKPRTDAAAQWEGWGTALKPAFEPIVLARKPLSEGTVAANVLRWGTGALNIDVCRIPGEPVPVFGTNGGQKFAPGGDRDQQVRQIGTNAAGRWPANVVHDGSDEVVAAFPSARSSGVFNAKDSGNKYEDRVTNFSAKGTPATMYGDSGSAARFFYSAKASKADRAGSKHPTVKRVDLMEWLATLITPPGGTVLDPFAGSGTTGAACRNKGFRCILIEREAEYVADIRARLGMVEPARLAVALQSRPALVRLAAEVQKRLSRAA